MKNHMNHVLNEILIILYTLYMPYVRQLYKHEPQLIRHINMACGKLMTGVWISDIKLP